MLELRHLKTLSTLSETGSFAKAASRLFLTPSALSHQVKELERHYGTKLVERAGRPARLTTAGRRLVELDEKIARLIRETETHLDRAEDGRSGELRIAVECHSCFDWLMPSMDAFRPKWPGVEMDLVSGFHPDPVGLLKVGQADLVIVSRRETREDIVYHPLFRYEGLGIVAKTHPLAKKPFLSPQDFAAETLITYPVPDDRLDVIRDFLSPAKIYPARRTTMLTVAILQLVASGRGVAGLPAWSVQSYLDRGYVAGRRLGVKGLFATLYAAVSREAAGHSYVAAFIKTMKSVSSKTLAGLSGLEK